MEDNNIKKDIRDFINLTTDDDHQAADKKLSDVIKAKVEQRYQDARDMVISEYED